MLESFTNNFEYKKLTEQEQQERGILGRLVGPIADTKNPTRNGRKYSKTLWEKVFDDPIVQEKIKNRCFFGELDHPADREETCSEKVAVCLAEKPQMGKDGFLYGVFDILPTPNGKILKTFCDYGTTVGISSRGSGDVLTDENGEEYVDENSYDCQGFDIVLVPAMESARLNYVTESLQNKPTLKQALLESLNKANADEKEVMEETLKGLKINLNEECNSENCSDKSTQIKENLETKKEVSNVESSSLVKSLQDALQSKLSLESQVQKLQEKLAVSDTKVKKLEEELSRNKSTVIRLSTIAQSNKVLKEENQSLKEELEKRETKLKTQSIRISKLAEKLNQDATTSKGLNENLNNKNKEITEVRKEYEAYKNSTEDKLNKLNEKLLENKVSSETKVKELTEKLTKSVKLVEKYKKYVETTVDKYIQSKAVMLGVNASEIKNRLNESYTLEDIDKICDELQVYNLRMSKLPFNLDKQTKVKITESKRSQYEPISPEDDIDGLVKFLKD